MGVFEFVIVLVGISTLGKVVTEINDRRALPPANGGGDAQEVEALREVVADLGTRLHRLEEERDFYRNLLEAPRESSALESSGPEDVRPTGG